MTRAPHGTRARFVAGCRCHPCRVARAAYNQEWEIRNRPPLRLRCVGGGKVWLILDRDTGAEVHRTLDREEAYLTWADLLDGWRAPSATCSPKALGMVRAHLLELRAAGLGLRQISAVSGVSRSRLSEIARGRGYNRDRPRKRQLRTDTAERILAVGTGDQASGASVDPADFDRIVCCLLGAGLSRAIIASAMLDRRAHALQVGGGRPVLRAQVDTIADVHAALWRSWPRLRESCCCGSVFRQPTEQAARAVATYVLPGILCPECGQQQRPRGMASHRRSHPGGSTRGTLLYKRGQAEDV